MSKRKLTIITILSLLILTGIYYTAANYGFFSGGTNAPSVPADTMTRGLVGYWEFDEGTGQTAYDGSNNSNNGQLGSTASSDDNDPSWTANGKNGGGMDFDGVDDYVDVGSSASTSSTEAISVEAWIKDDNTVGGHIVSKDLIGASKGWALNASNGDTSFYIGGLSYKLAVGTLFNDVWNHVVGVYDGSHVIIYINGIETVGDAITGSIAYSSNNLHIGKRNDTTSNYFNGSIDSVRIYNRALSADEVRYHYNRGGPVGSWNFDEGSGLTAFDGTGNNNDGTLKSSGLEFDGVNDYVDCGNGDSLKLSTSGTVEAWVNANNPTAGSWQGVISKWGGHDEYNYWLGIKNNNYFYFAFDGGNIVYSKNIATTSWHHLVGIADASTGETYLYLDGVLQNTNTIYDGISQTSNVIVKIGDTSSFNGSIDEVRIYNTALSAEEIARQYNNDFSQDPTGNLVLLQHFEEGLSCSANDPDPGSADCLTDDSGSGNHGTLHNFDNLSAWDTSPDGWVSDVKKESLRWTNGKYKTAGEFNGWDDYVDGGSASSLDTGTVLSVSAWFRLDAASDTGFIVSKMADSFLDGWALQHSGNDLHFYQNATFTSLFTTSNIITDTDWHYAAVVIDGSGNNAIYFDGSIVDTDNRTVDMDSTATLKIGANLGTYANYTDGFIDDVRIYNYARTAGEIRLDYNAGVATHLGPSDKTCSEDPAGCMDYGLVGSWGMDEGTGQSVYDASDNGNDGTLGASASSASDDPRWTTDSSPLAGGGGSLKFDGVDDYVDCGNDTSLRNHTSMTVSFWMKYNHTDNDGYGIISHFNGNNTGNENRLGVNNNGLDVYYQMGGSQGHITTPIGGLSNNNWYYVVVSLTNGSQKIYIDGIQSGSIGTIAADLDGGSQPLYIGDTFSWNHFNGSIDSVRIYNRALSAEEVRYHYNKGGPVAEWKFDEGSGTTVYDSSGGGFHGTLTP